jgi:hypothetical protein
MADLLAPQTNQQGDPAQLGQKLQQAAQQNQALTMLVRKLQQALESKLPQVEADKWKAAIDSLTKIRVAEINASKDIDRSNADRDAATLEHLTGLAHETALSHVQHEHDSGMAEKNAAIASAQQQQQREAEPETSTA